MHACMVQTLRPLKSSITTTQYSILILLEQLIPRLVITMQFEVVDVLGLERSTYALAMTVSNVLDDYRLCVEEVNNSN